MCPKEIWPDVEVGVTAAPHGAVPQFSFRLYALSSLSSFAISSHLQNPVPRPSWKLVVFRILYTLSTTAHPSPSPLFSFFKKHFLLVPPPRRTSAGHIQLLRCCPYLEAQFIFEQLSQSPKQKKVTPSLVPHGAVALLVTIQFVLHFARISLRWSKGCIM